MSAVKLREYLARLSERPDRAEFVTQYPRSVLLELEGPADDIPSGDDSATRALGRAALQRASLSSDDARVLVLEPGEAGLRVGRGAGADVAIDHASVSKDHAWLWPADEGGFRLEDLGSTNGTFLNNIRLSPRQPTLLRPNDVVWFGRATGFSYQSADGLFDYLTLLKRFGL